jgi:hypothetical protein
VKPYFKDVSFDYLTRTALGSSFWQCADAGEVLATIDGIKDGHAASWVEAWKSTGDRLRDEADRRQADGHERSAAAAYLRAAKYYDTAGYSPFADEGEAQFNELWEAYRSCWDAFLDLGGHATPAAGARSSSTMAATDPTSSSGRRPPRPWRAAGTCSRSTTLRRVRPGLGPARRRAGLIDGSGHSSNRPPAQKPDSAAPPQDARPVGCCLVCGSDSLSVAVARAHDCGARRTRVQVRARVGYLGFRGR